MGRLDGKIAIVTGGAAGIGEMVVEVFAREGAAIAIIDRDRETMGKTVAAIQATGAEIIGIQGDVASAPDVDRAMRTVAERFGRIDILVNNAGVGDFHYAVTRTSDELWREVCDVNQTGVFHCCRAVLQYMESAGGSIVNVSSIAGVLGSAGVAYSATKAAVIGITKNIAMQYAGGGIRCNAVCPGPTQWTSLNWPPEETVKKLDQEMLKITGNHWNSFTPWTTREDQANAILFFASDESKSITGQYIVVDNGKTL